MGMNVSFCSPYHNSVGFCDICPGETNLAGKVFLILFSLCGLGIFCGPIMDLASSWRHQIPGGLPTLASFTIGIGVMVFTTFEGLAQTDAIYASVITGMSKFAFVGTISLRLTRSS